MGHAAAPSGAARASVMLRAPTINTRKALYNTRKYRGKRRRFLISLGCSALPWRGRSRRLGSRRERNVVGRFRIACMFAAGLVAQTVVGAEQRVVMLPVETVRGRARRRPASPRRRHRAGPQPRGRSCTGMHRLDPGPLRPRRPVLPRRSAAGGARPGASPTSAPSAVRAGRMGGSGDDRAVAGLALVLGARPRIAELADGAAVTVRRVSPRLRTPGGRWSGVARLESHGRNRW